MNTQNKPGLVMAIALMTLVNGIFNIIWGITIIHGTGFLSLICAAPVPLFPIILGGFEIAYALKLLSTPSQPVKPSQTIAILEITTVLVGNVFSMVVGILALVFYNDQVVKDYFAQLNGTQTPPPAPSFDAAQDKIEPAPAQPIESTPAPEVPMPPAEPEAPADADTPAQPKRVRKVAKK